MLANFFVTKRAKTSQKNVTSVTKMVKFVTKKS